MEDNIPYGFEDPGLKIKPSSKAIRTDLENKKFKDQFKNFPQTPEEAEAALWKISQSRNSINNENTI